MSDKERPFGVFGTPSPNRGKGGFPLIRVVMGIILLSAIPLAISGWDDLYRNIIEREPPDIKIVKAPPGIGVAPSQLIFTVKDIHSGVDQVIVRAEQGNDVQTILKKSFPSRSTEETITLPLDGKELSLREGPLRLSIVAFDRSFWSSSFMTTIDTVVDFEAPRIEVLTRQHNAARGGVELVFYRVIGDKDGFSGIAVGPNLFPGFAAKTLDPVFEALPDVYFAFFAVPMEFNEEQNSLQVLARDPVGNSAFASFYYKVRDRKVKDVERELGREFFEGAVDRVFQEYQLTEAKLSGRTPEEFIPAIRDEELIERFQTINTTYRKKVDQAAKQLFGRPKTARFWKGVFARPAGGTRRNAFGEHLNYLFEGRALGDHVEPGICYESENRPDVRAANAGVVIFASELGVYGKTIIVDHGFGLTTLYSHLSKMEKVEGDRVSKSELIGQMGMSGLVNTTSVCYEIRLHSVPVNPYEWWDKKWIEAHIFEKVTTVKRELGLPTLRPLD